MAGRDRLAALKRARERQRKVEEQIARTIRAYTAAERARTHRDRVVERADLRVTEAADLATRETAFLVSTCGSVEAAAEILALDIRQIRRAVSVTESSTSPRDGSDR